MRLAQKINDEIIYYPALGIKHAGIERFTRLCQFVYIIGEQPPQESAHIFAYDIYGKHMRNIKHAGITSHLMMFIKL